MLAVVYVRVSTEDQARYGYSLEAQEAACRKKAQELGATQVEIYRDEGVTGEILERPGLQAALAAVNAGAAWFVVYDPDRLSRKLAHQLLLVEMIEKAGCRLEFVTCEWQDTPEGRLFYSLRGAIAEFEKEKFKARSRFGKLAKARRGLLTHNPRVYGYRYSGGQLEVDENQAAVYHRMVDMALLGMSPEAIAAQLNSEATPAPQGGKWYRATIRRILKNPTYTGILRLNRYNAEGIKAARQRGQKANRKVRPEAEWITVPVPALIEREKWVSLQDSLCRLKKGSRGGRVHRYYLAGLVVCGLCGRSMAGQCGNSRNKKTYRYYACLNTWEWANIDRREPVPRCSNGMHRADTLEEAVWAKVREWLEDPEALLRDVRQDAMGDRIDKEAGRIQKRLEQIKRERERTFEAYRRGLVEMEMFEQAMQVAKKEENALKEKLAEMEEARHAAAIAEQGVETLHLLADEVAGRLDELDWDEREKLIRILVRHVVVKEGEVLVEARIQSGGDASHTGTAPHVVDPRYPGAVDEIVNLGEFWDTSRLSGLKEAIISVSERVGRHFAAAYSSLRLAKMAREEEKGYRAEAFSCSRFNSMIGDLFRRALGEKMSWGGGTPQDRHLFASALTPQGIVHHLPTVLEGIESLYGVEGEPGSGKEFLLAEFAGYAYRCGLKVEIYHCAFDPSQVDLVVVPERGTAIINLFPELSFKPDSLQGLKSFERIDLNACLDPGRLNDYAEELAETREIYERCLERGLLRIRKAKRVHDEMERYYVAAMDFAGVEDKRREILNRILEYAR